MHNFPRANSHPRRSHTRSHEDDLLGEKRSARLEWVVSASRTSPLSAEQRFGASGHRDTLGNVQLDLVGHPFRGLALAFQRTEGKGSTCFPFLARIGCALCSPACPTLRCAAVPPVNADRFNWVPIRGKQQAQDGLDDKRKRRVRTKGMIVADV